MVESQRRPRGPGTLFATLSIVMLVVLGFVALTATQPPPPTIAEFAPQAVDQITDAPSEQSSQFGRGGEGECPPGATDCVAGEGGGGAAGSAPAAKPPPIDVSRVRRCVGDPPRQIEDPQSPPCVPFWEGDNGGSTWKGVTADTIRIAMPDFAEGRDRALEAFFNNRFEFYGRKIQLIKCCKRGGAVAAQNEAAVEAVDVHDVFASADYPDIPYAYHRALARAGRVASTSQPLYSESDLSKLHPHIWQYPMANNAQFSNLGEWICKQVANRPARFAGRRDVTDMSTEQRRFGLFSWSEIGDQDLDSGPVKAELDKCGAQPVLERRSSTRQGEGAFNQQIAANAVLDFKERGVTTVICLCHGIVTGQLQRQAAGHQYQPEWLVLTYMLQDYDFIVTAFMDQPTQRQRMFGLSFIPKQNPVDQTPSWWAVREGDPSQGGSASGSSASLTPMNINYRSLLLLASGIQMAGPTLTPETFARGLQSTRFPNPDHRIMAGKVGFEGGTHSMTKDGAQIWWSETTKGPYTDGYNGTYCYIDGGVRYSQGRWPTGDTKAFQGDLGDCR